MNTLLVAMSCLSANIVDWLFEALTKPLFTLITVFEGIFKGLAGIVDPASSDIGLTNNAAESKSVIVQLMQSSTMQNIMTSLMLFGVVVLVLSVILAIIRNIYKDDSKVTISSIIGQAIKAVIGFILVPALCLIGVMISNVILVAVDGATNAAGTASFAAGIYSACQRETPVDNVFNDVVQSSPIYYEDLFDSAGSGEEGGETVSRPSDNELLNDLHLSGIIYAQYLWQAFTENCKWQMDNNGSYYVATRQSHNAYTAGDYLDVLGLKVNDPDLVDFSDVNNWNNGNGKDGVIDTKEDVELFYEMLTSQYLHNFPNAPTYEEWFFGTRAKYYACPIKFVVTAGWFTKEYFGAGSDKGEIKENSFVYYYYGKPIFDYNNGSTDEFYLKKVYQEFKENDTFGATSWTLKKSSSQWTNDNLNKTLCLGDDINYFYAFITSVMVAKSLFFLCFGMAKRIVQLALYYVLSPIALALYPFDNGKAFGSWKSDFVGYTVGAYGAVAGVNLTIQLMPVINKVTIFSSALYNDVTRLILYIILAQGMEALVKTLSGWIGGKDLLAEGKSTANSATAPIALIKKVAGSVMRVAGTAVGTVVGVGIGAAAARKNRGLLDNLNTKMTGSAADQQAAEEEAKAAGYSSASAYAADLSKNASNGDAWYKGGGLGTALRNTAKSKANQVVSSTASKFPSTQFGLAFDKETGLSSMLSKSAAQKASQKVKADLNANFETDFRSGVATAKMSAELTKELQDIKQAFTTASTNNTTAIGTYAGQIAGLKFKSPTDAKKFIETGDVSLLDNMSAKAQTLAMQARSSYLASDEYQTYAQSLRSVRSYGYDERSISAVDPTKAIDSLITIMRTKLDLSNFQTAQKEGNEQEMRRLMTSATGVTDTHMLEELVKRLSHTTAYAAETIEKTATEAGEKAAKASEARFKGQPPKK